jgi:multidrug resistance efflux pump
VEEAKANLDYIETEIQRCLVRAPLDGEILKVDVRVGEFVQSAGRSDLFLLGDLTHWHVRAEFDEENIPRFDPTAPAKAVPRGDTARSYTLVRERTEPLVVPKRMLTGDNVERVDTRVLQVVYRIVAPDAGLLVGQQVDVFLESDRNAETAHSDSRHLQNLR